jgi:hypothetical protein
MVDDAVYSRLATEAIDVKRMLTALTAKVKADR